VFVLRSCSRPARPTFLAASPVWAVCFSLVLVGCGGGSSEPDTTSPTAPTLDTEGELPSFEVPENWQTDAHVWADNEEFLNQSGLATINAQEAYARGLTGQGQVIGFVDTGIDETHAEFDRKNIRLNDRSGVPDATRAQLSHGTGVASIALGARGYGRGLHGVPLMPTRLFGACASAIGAR
jgi:subtilisin family serine protease